MDIFNRQRELNERFTIVLFKRHQRKKSTNCHFFYFSLATVLSLILDKLKQLKKKHSLLEHGCEHE